MHSKSTSPLKMLFLILFKGEQQQHHSREAVYRQEDDEATQEHPTAND